MKISVIIPYKEDRGWLRFAIESIGDKAQVILSQGNGSWPQNFNKALSKVEGDFVKFLHEDDMLTHGAIDTYTKAFENPLFKDIMFAHGNAYEIYPGNGREPKLYIPRVKVPRLEDLLFKNTIHSTSLIYRKEVFDKLGGISEDPKFHSFEEFEFNLRCLKEGFKIGYIDYVFAYYRRHPKQIIRTCDVSRRKRYRDELVNKYYNYV